MILLLGGCLHPPHELAGATCDRDEDCGPELVCARGVCARPSGDAGDDSGPAPDAGAPQVLPNGSFEEGLTGWTAVGSAALSTVEGGRGGMRSARVEGPDGGTSSFQGISTVPVKPVEPDTLYCASVWIQRGTISEYFRLTLRRYDASSAWEDVSGDVLVPPDDAWVELRGQLSTTAPYHESVTLRVHAPFEAGRWFHVDDARLWPADGGCH